MECNLCKELKEDAKILEKISKELGIELAVCYPRQTVSFGTPTSVKVTLPCKCILHTHLFGEQPSPADLEASKKTTVCLVYNGKVKCYKDGKLICKE